MNQLLTDLLPTVLSADGVREDFSRCSVAVFIGRTAVHQRLFFIVDVAVACGYGEDVLDLLVLNGSRAAEG